MKSPYGLPCIESCLSCKLRSDDFFCALSKESLKAFNQIKHATVFPQGAVIFVEGQTPRGIFMLCQGQAKLSTTSREGKRPLSCGSQSREKSSVYIRLLRASRMT